MKREREKRNRRKRRSETRSKRPRSAPKGAKGHSYPMVANKKRLAEAKAS